MAEETVQKHPDRASTPEPEVTQASLNKFSNDGTFLKKFREEMSSRQKNRCEKPLDKPAKQVTTNSYYLSSLTPGRGGGRRHYYNMTVHTCTTQTQVYPLRPYG